MYWNIPLDCVRSLVWLIICLIHYPYQNKARMVAEVLPVLRKVQASSMFRNVSTVLCLLVVWILAYHCHTSMLLLFMVIQVCHSLFEFNHVPVWAGFPGNVLTDMFICLLIVWTLACDLINYFLTTVLHFRFVWFSSLLVMRTLLSVSTSVSSFACYCSLCPQ